MDKKVLIEVLNLEMSSLLRMGSGSERFQIVGAANENDLQPYFFNFADGTDRSLLGEDLKLLDGLDGAWSCIPHVFWRERIVTAQRKIGIFGLIIFPQNEKLFIRYMLSA